MTVSCIFSTSGCSGHGLKQAPPQRQQAPEAACPLYPAKLNSMSIIELCLCSDYCRSMIQVTDSFMFVRSMLKIEELGTCNCPNDSQ